MRILNNARLKQMDTWRDYKLKQLNFIYIAGKIGDLPEGEYKRNFQEAKTQLSKKGFVGISPLEIVDGTDGWLECMKVDLTVMMRCAGVFAQRNWQDSPGATIEVNLALRLGIPVMFQADIDKEKLIDSLTEHNLFCGQ